VILLTGRRISIAVILAIAVVFGLAGWRWFSGAAEKPTIARPAAPIAKPATPAVAAATETPALLTQLESTQQNVVDDLQLMQARVAKQDAEIKRLRAELDTLSQRYDTLTSFASTPKEARAEPDVQPPQKKKKRFVRRSVKKPAA
jgi:TolA-binding protein